MKRKLLFAFLILSLLTGCQARPARGPVPGETITIHTYEDETEAYLHSCLDAFLFDGDRLPSRTPSGDSILWKVQRGNAVIEDNIIHKTEQAVEYELIDLSLSCQGREIEFRNVTLQDPAVGYVIAYFSSEGVDREQLKLAYTFNSTYWFKLHNDRGILKPSTGTKRLRDPSFVRRPGGGFSLLATQGYDTDSIYVYDTDDMITYRSERLLRLNAAETKGAMSESQAWAPEAFYDINEHCYVILWSAPADGGIYYTLSRGLSDCTYPVKMNDPGFPVIDITMVRSPHGWTAVLKDEREPMEAYSQILRGTGPSWNSLSAWSDPVYDRHQVEGPMIMKSLEKPGWYVTVDDYTRSAYKLLYTEDIETGSFEEIEETDPDFMIPLYMPSHPNAIRVTWKEIKRLQDAFEP